MRLISITNILSSAWLKCQGEKKSVFRTFKKQVV